jgi:hypothetical protein
MNPIFSFFKFFIDDFKTDLIVIKRIFTEEKFFTDGMNRIQTAMTSLSVKRWLEISWPMILLVILAFFSGWLLASRYYEGLCNQYLYDNFLVPKLNENVTKIYNFTFQTYK